MAQCEDFPCCGHELGCCPDYDSETGAQLNMVCTCGAKLPIDSRFSICSGCLRMGDSNEPGFDPGPDMDDLGYESWDGDEDDHLYDD